jgi:hypothetical protein
MLLTVFCYSPYGYSLVMLDIVVALLFVVLPLVVAAFAFNWANRLLQRPDPRTKQRAQLVLASLTLAVVGYFYWVFSGLINIG